MPPGARWGRHRAGAAPSSTEGRAPARRGSPACTAPARPTPASRHLLSPGRSPNPCPNPSWPPGPQQDAQRPPPPLPPGLPSPQAPGGGRSWLRPLYSRGRRAGTPGLPRSAARGWGGPSSSSANLAGRLSAAANTGASPAAVAQATPSCWLLRTPPRARADLGPLAAGTDRRRARRACLFVVLFALVSLGTGQLLGGAAQGADCLLQPGSRSHLWVQRSLTR